MSGYEIVIRAGEDYILAATQMDDQINRYRDQGWQLHGHTQMILKELPNSPSGHPRSEVIFMQVMVLPPSVLPEFDDYRKK